MNRREFIVASAGLAGAILIPSIAEATPPTPLLTFSRNGIAVPFYDHEMPGDGWGCPERERIRQIFYELDEHSRWESSYWDLPCWQWPEDNYRFPIDELNSLLKGPFRWYGWFDQQQQFHLLHAGVAPGRFEYSNSKVSMFEREMYSGDGCGCAREKCLLPGPYDALAQVTYDKAHFKVACNTYWTTTLPGIGCVVRWRYKTSEYHVV